MKEFFKNLVSGSNEVSSKRFFGALIFLSAIEISHIAILGKCDDIAPNKLALINTMYMTGGFLLGISLVELFKPKQ